ncbi:MAG: flagellar hook-associated 2 domain protein [Ilumatobacteraceae bacterium]|nr:flagellar hook-associated 2 domain protein [Ilumatobacteraceae bacterium]
MSNSISFSAGGIDVSAIVSSLMDAERAPITTLQNRQAAVKLQSDAVTRLKNNVTSLNTLAGGLLTSGITKLSSNVSIPSLVSASVSATAKAGSVTFTVDALARAQGLRTAATVGATTSVVTSATALAISSTSRQLGIGSISVGAGVTAGKYDVSVTQSTVGAVRSGTSAMAPSTLIDGTNNTLSLDIDGVGHTDTIAAGTYTPAALVDAVQDALDAGPAAATASLDPTGHLRITTDHEGSVASLQITGGTALAALGLGVDASAITGTDGIVQIGTNPPVTITSAGTGATVAVPTGTGDLTMTLDGGLRTGTSKISVVSTGDRSLGAVVAAINGAGVGASASAVKVSDGNWLLQINATNTGVNNALSLDSSIFASAGGLLETSTARDAQITIGTGPGAYSVTASGNVFSDLMQGVTLTATAESAAPVTVNVNRDDTATADNVDKLVAAVNSVLADIALQTKYDTTTKTGSPLSGDASVRRLAEQLRSSVTSIVGSTNQAASVGITTQRDGTLKFDRDVFQAAMVADPSAVERVFARGGSSTGGVQFAAAADNTVAGTYAVVVTTAATRATTGAVLVGGSALGQRIGVRVGSVTATYDAAAGATAADIAAGLNGALGRAGLTVNAEVNAGGVSLTSSKFGGGGAFETNLDVNGAGSWATSTGDDVVGTIDGQPAIGVGQRLRLLGTDSSLARGLEVDVDEGVTGTIGPVSYDPGIAARLVSLATAATGDGGSLTISSDTYTKKYDGYDEQISAFEARMVTKEAQLRRQWTTVQSLLTNLESQKNWLSSQLGAASSSS